MGTLGKAYFHTNFLFLPMKVDDLGAAITICPCDIRVKTALKLSTPHFSQIYSANSLDRLLTEARDC